MCLKDNVLAGNRKGDLDLHFSSFKEVVTGFRVFVPTYALWLI